ncbi:MAG TPA: ribonuclease H-like domain-containing protein [Anaeromyxobacteraceae bacterium]|nr:ribonuclease H-like domain-containing protein [Anaeromyxobacteraceae bacterium]
MIRSTFRLAPGIGPWLEGRLWSAGIIRWEDLPPEPAVALSPRLDARLRPAVRAAEAALARGDAGALAAMLPRPERWRLHGAFAEETAYLDVETDGDALTAVGVLDARGPRIFLAGRDLDAFPEAARGWKVLATYNGLAFDLPVLRRAFPRWRPPVAHVDLRHLWSRLGHRGGLKALEEACGRPRPPHLRGLDGRDAVRLWRRHLDGDAAALRLFAEYNLHDAVSLRTLLDLGYNRMIERLRLPAPPVRVSERGDVLYDVTRRVWEL